MTRKPSTGTTKKILLLLFILLICMMLVFLTDQPIDLALVQSVVSDVKEWHQQNLIAFVALFFTLYVLVTATSLPIAVWMTLAAGALFGLWWGLLLVSFASSIGATLRRSYRHDICYGIG